MIHSLLNEHVEYMIAINATDPVKLESCGLKSVNTEYFSVVTQKGLLVHIPLSRIISIIENNEGGGVKVGGGFNKAVARVVVQVEHMIVYNGGSAIGFSTPI